MNTKIEFAAELPAELIAALGLCEETGFRAWFENGALHVRVDEEASDYDEEAFRDGFSEGYDAGTEEGFGDGHAAGYEEGLAEGYERGYLDGIGNRTHRSTGVSASREEGRKS